MEIFWGTAALITAAFVGFFISKTSFSESGIMLILPFVCAILWGLRRAVRKKEEKFNAQQKGKDS